MLFGMIVGFGPLPVVADCLLWAGPGLGDGPQRCLCDMETRCLLSGVSILSRVNEKLKADGGRKGTRLDGFVGSVLPSQVPGGLLSPLCGQGNKARWQRPEASDTLLCRAAHLTVVVRRCA